MNHSTSAMRSPAATPYRNTLAMKKGFVCLCFMPRPFLTCASALAWHRAAVNPSSYPQGRAFRGDAACHNKETDPVEVGFTTDSPLPK
jgi:hypothetical protein